MLEVGRRQCYNVTELLNIYNNKTMRKGIGKDEKIVQPYKTAC